MLLLVVQVLQLLTLAGAAWTLEHPVDSGGEHPSIWATPEMENLTCMCNHKTHPKTLKCRDSFGGFVTGKSAQYLAGLSKALTDLHINHILTMDQEALEGAELMQELKLSNGREALFQGDRVPTPPIHTGWDGFVFKEVFRVLWERTEPSNIVEARQILFSLRHIMRNSQNWGKRVLIVTDNLCALACLSKGRSSSRAMSLICKRVAAICLVFRLTVLYRWVPSKRNFADGPSRGRNIVAVCQDPGVKKSYHG